MADTREKIQELARILIQTKGYNAFSFADIAGPLQIKNAAIHYHFPSKEALGVSVITEGTMAMQEAFNQWSSLPERQQVEAFVTTFGQWQQQGLVCLMGSLSPDFGTLPAGMQQGLHQMCTSIIDWLTERLEQGRQKQQFHFEGDARVRAMMVVSHLISSLLLSRVFEEDTLSQTTPQLLQDLF